MRYLCQNYLYETIETPITCLRQSKNIHTGRGAVRRMSFSPGKNNLKLLVLLEAGVQIWDVRELELINELRTPLDTARVEDGDWASSDRVVLAGQDGCIRLAGLALAGTSSHCLAYGRHQVRGDVSINIAMKFSR